MSEDQLEMLITQTINGAVATIPAYLEEIKQNKEKLKVENPQEFVYGIVMGMALGMSGAILSAQKRYQPQKTKKKLGISYTNTYQKSEKGFSVNEVHQR